MKIVLSNNADKFFEESVSLIELSIRSRIKIALKKFFLFLSIAVLMIFIPVLHFFLVPLFLIIAIVMGALTFKVKYKLILNKSEKCLECKFPLSAFYNLTDELKFKCSTCSSHYLIFK